MKISEDNFSTIANPTSQLQLRFVETLARSGKSIHTIKAYSADLTDFFRWFDDRASDPTLAAIDSQDILSYRESMQARHQKPATINRRLKTLRKFFQWCIKQKLLQLDPFELIEKLTVSDDRKTAPKWLKQNEQRSLLRVVRQGESVRDYAIIQTFLGTGVRISELAALKVSDLVIGERGGWLTVREGKGSKRREIPLDLKTRQALSVYLKEREEDTGERLFSGQRGPINTAGINYLVDKYARQAELTDCTPHTLRHSFAKNLVDAGAPLDQVAALLGHEDLNTTRIYTKPSREDLELAVRRAGGEI